MPEPFKDCKSGKYYVSFSFRGQRFKRSTGTENLSRARRLQRIIDGRVEELKSGLAEVPHGVSLPDYVFDNQTEPDPDEEPESTMLQEFTRSYLREAAPPNRAESTYNTERIHLEHLRDFAEEEGVVQVANLDGDFFEAYKRSRYEEGLKNSTINRELTTFRIMFNLAIKRGLVESNPVKGVKQLKEDSSFTRFRTGDEIRRMVDSGRYTDEQIKEARRYRYLTQEELKRLLEMAKDSEIHAFIAVAAYTGMRFSEIRRLKWNDVDFVSQKILARGYKGSQTEVESARHIPIHPALIDILQQHRQEGSSAWLFSDENGERHPKDFYYWRLQKLTDGTEFEGVRFHTFRHSFASNLAIKGVDQRLIDEWMGHQTEEMRKRYQHLFPEAQRKEISRLEF